MFLIEAGKARCKMCKCSHKERQLRVLWKDWIGRYAIFCPECFTIMKYMDMPAIDHKFPYSFFRAHISNWFDLEMLRVEE